MYGHLPQDFWIEYALRQIKADYGVEASVEEKDKALNKFGTSTQVNTTNRVTLETLPTGVLNETYLTDNLITHVSSSAGDTGSMPMEGFTVDASGDFTFVEQTVTLAGQTKTELATPLARCTRMYNDTATAWTGSIYAYEDDTVVSGVPQTDTKVHCMIAAGKQQTTKASTTLSKRDYWIITTINTGVLTKTGTNLADIELQQRRDGKVFRPLAELMCSSTTQGIIHPFPYLIIPANADVRLSALGSGNLEVFGYIRGVLAIDRDQL